MIMIEENKTFNSTQNGQTWEPSQANPSECQAITSQEGRELHEFGIYTRIPVVW
jgi:hypothetical protein